MDEKQKLYNFIVDNHDLEILESKIEVFNPFKVLEIENYEIRHSNVLAWLLNPTANHGLFDFFLKKVLSIAVLQNENIDLEINLLNIHLSDFSDSIVTREESNIDILLRSKKNKILFLIENKINSKESKNQLTKYLNYVKSSYPKYKIVPILLTKTGDEPENNDSYGILTHEIIHKLLKETLELKKEYLTKEISDFIEFYLKTLEKTLDMNEDLKELCLTIYNKHKDAIDLIIETINSDETSLKEAFDDFISKHEIEVFYNTSKELWFLPTQLTEILPKNDLGWRVPYPIATWFTKRSDSSIKFILEVGPFTKGEYRLDFINFLEKNGYSIRTTSKRLESKYTRLATNYLKVNDLSNKEEIMEVVGKLYEKNNAEIKKIIKVAKEYKFHM